MARKPMTKDKANIMLAGENRSEGKNATDKKKWFP